MNEPARARRRASGLDVFELHAATCRTLSSPIRLKMLALMGRREQRVGELAETIGISLSNASQHLAVLKSHDLVLTRKEGQTVWCRLADRRIIQACSLIRAVLLDTMKQRGLVARDVDPRYLITLD